MKGLARLLVPTLLAVLGNASRAGGAETPAAPLPAPGAETGLQDSTRQAPADSLRMMRPGVVRLPSGEEKLLLPTRLPFGEGEVMEYEIRYGFVSVGKARLETESLGSFEGRTVLKILSQAKSAKWIDTVYKVRDEVQSLLDIERMHSLRTSKRLREGNYKSDLVAEYRHEEGRVRYGDGSESDMVPGSQDILTALFYARTFALEPGMTLKIPIHDGKKSYPLQVEVTGREAVETALGRIVCLVLEPRLQSQGLFKSEGRMQIYLSDDARRLPVLLKARAPVGSFESQLISYQSGRPLLGVSWVRS